jgi:hypothetical protein
MWRVALNEHLFTSTQGHEIMQNIASKILESRNFNGVKLLDIYGVRCMGFLSSALSNLHSCCNTRFGMLNSPHG